MLALGLTGVGGLRGGGSRPFGLDNVHLGAWMGFLDARQELSIMRALQIARAMHRTAREAAAGTGCEGGKDGARGGSRTRPRSG